MSFTFGSNNVQQQPSAQSGFAFGQQQQQNKGFGFGTTPSTGFGFGTPTTTTASTGFSFGAASTTPASSGFSFGTPSTFSLGTQNAAPTSGGGLTFGNQAPTTSSSGFLFGATAPTPRPMFGPTTTSSAVTFGTTQPAMGGSFGFGAAAPNATAPNATNALPFGSGNLSFGPVTSAFGVATTTTNSGFQFGVSPALPVTTTAPTGLQFGPQPPTTGFQFNSTPASTNALQFGASSNTSTAQSGFGFGVASTVPATGLTFGVPSTSTPVQTAPFNLSTTAPTVPATTATGFVVGGSGFGIPTTTTAINMFGAAPATSTVGTGFGMQSVAPTTTSQFGAGVNIATVAPVGFNATTTSQAAGAAGVTSAVTSAPGFQFGPPSSTNSFAFGVKPVSSNVETSISEPFQLSSSSVPSFGFPPASVSTSIAPTSEPSQKIQATGPIPSTASTALPAFSFATAPSTSTPGFSFPNLKPAGSTAVTTSATPSPFGAVATLSSAPSVSSAITSAVLSTTTSVTQSTSTSIMNFRQLEDAINKWKIELEEQEKIFIDQATQVNAWDRLLIANGEKITVLNDAVERVKLDQQRLDLELDFILAQQSELEEILVPLEKSMEASPNMHAQQHADLEREHTYHLAENIDAQLKRMSEDIREIIEHVNTANKARDDQDPVQQIAKILNAHMDALQWIDQNTVALQKRLEGISKIHETEKRETETSFRGGY